MPGIDDLLSTPALLAQGGIAKTMLGYVAVGVMIVIALALICRPSHRPDEILKKKKK
jgi:hypothetical protein